MKITFVIPSANLSGGCRIIAEHARMLHERGHTVTVVAARRVAPRLSERLKGLVLGRENRAQGQGPSHLDDAPYAVKHINRVRPIVADDVPDADLIVSSWWHTTEWVWKMPESKGVKVNFLQHHEVHPWLPVERVRAVWRLPIPKIVVSRWLQDIARDEYNDHDAILVPNGLDTDHFRFVERGPTGRCVIGTMDSGLTQNNFKRFWLAVESVRALQARGTDCRFIGFGTAVTDPSDLPPGSSFEVKPSQERIAEIYASCDCWLFTSDKEGYGLPLLESMSCGTPVVATPAGAAPELLETGGGELVDSDDPERIADAIERVTGLDDASWREMSRAARAEAQRHSWAVIGDQMEAALRACLERKPSA